MKYFTWLLILGGVLITAHISLGDTSQKSKDDSVSIQESVAVLIDSLSVLKNSSPTLYADVKFQIETELHKVPEKDHGNYTELFYKYAYFLYKNSLYDDSYYWTKKNLDYYLEVKDTINMSRYLNFLGGVQFRLRDFEKAYDFYSKALKIAEKTQKDSLLAAAYNNVGMILAYLDSTKGVILYYEKSIEKNIKMKRIVPLAHNYGNLGAYLTEKGDSSAIIYLRKRLNIFDSIQMPLYQCSANRLVGNYFRKFGVYDSARIYLNVALELAKSIDNNFMSALMFHDLSSLFRENGNYEKALNFHEQYLAKYDSLGLEKMRNNIEVQQLKLTLEKEEILREEQARIAQFAREKELEVVEQKRFLAFSILILLGIMTIVIVFYRKELSRSRLVIDQDNMKLMKLHVQKKLFFSFFSKNFQDPVLKMKINAENLLSRFENGENEKLRNDVVTYFFLVEKLYASLSAYLTWARIRTGKSGIDIKKHKISELWGNFDMELRKRLGAKKKIGFKEITPEKLSELYINIDQSLFVKFMNFVVFNFMLPSKNSCLFLELIIVKNMVNTIHAQIIVQNEDYVSAYHPENLKNDEHKRILEDAGVDVMDVSFLNNKIKYSLIFKK